MEKPMERRSPERERHTLTLLRRLSALALAATVILLLAPRLLAYFGLIGPSVGDRIAEAERAVRAAESYGARPDHAALVAAREELDSARRLAREGQDRAARRAARQATARATEAQAAALVSEGQARQRAAAVVEDLDRRVNELEGLFAKVSPGLGREERSALLKRMRAARKAAATVFLAHDEKRFEDALAREEEARRALAETRAVIEAGGHRPSGPPVPFEAVGACPFECCIYREWTVERATGVRADRRADAAVVFTLQPGERAEAVTGVVVVSKPGRARAPRDLEVEGLRLGRGDEVAVLHPLGEGFWRVWHEGKTASVELASPASRPAGPSPVLHLVDKPQFVWWVQLRDTRGRSGWTEHPGNFGNKDRCG
jgi:hypothetical protein